MEFEGLVWDTLRDVAPNLMMQTLDIPSPILSDNLVDLFSPYKAVQNLSLRHDDPNAKRIKAAVSVLASLQLAVVIPNLYLHIQQISLHEVTQHEMRAQ